VGRCEKRDRRVTQGDAEIVALTRPRDTIYALSTAPGRSGVAVIRVSGPAAGDAVEALTGRAPPEPRRAVVRRFWDAEGAAIDHGLVLWFEEPESFTGEDVAEFQVHGGRAIVEAMQAALARVPGLRLARPGEFTRRAVEDGKFDLTAAEGLADLIAAETETQRRQALRQYDGVLADLYEGWRTELVGQAAWIEATIDFSDEELPSDLLARARAVLASVADAIARHIDDGGRGEIVREGLRIALIGPPNAGKSSLLNALARRDVAIVSETPGTTRDVIEVRLDLGGFPVVVADTAGLREAGDAVEEEGVRRALARARAAELVVLVLDGTSDARPPVAPDVAERLYLTVWNKRDLAMHAAGASEVNISAKTGEGIDQLVEALTAKAAEIADTQSEAPPLTRARHREALVEAEAALRRALGAPDDHTELMAEDVRLALRALGRITGRVDVEELLDVIFRDFCIGK
jgi:tRNA modification GTPase